VYLDLFAGSGLVSIEGTPDVVGGSPLVACSGGKFDYSILVEIKKQKAEALDERLGVFLPKEKYHVIQGNCNEKVDEIISEIKSKVSKPIILAFVDPEGMEIKFETLKRISSAFPNTDFMINVTAGGDRVGATVRDGNVANLPIFEDYFPKGMAGEILLKMNSGQPVEKQYEDMVKEVLGRPVGVTIPVNDVGERVMYYVMAYTRESYGGSGWKNILEHIRDQLRGVDGVEAGNTLDIIKGRRGTLDPYASSS
jgi:three-Cys-motif partner protein